MRPIAAVGRIESPASGKRTLAMMGQCLALLVPIALVAAGCETEGGTAVEDPVLPATVEAVSTLPDTATAGVALATPLRVRVIGTDGAPLSDVAVAWRIVAGGGTLGADTTRTDAEGTAGVEWTLGTTAGANTAAASVAGLAEAVFTLVGGPGAPAAVSLSAGELDFAAVGESTTLTAAVADAFGNAIAGATLAWTSSEAAVATVTGAGKVVAKGQGTARIIVRAGDAADTAVVVVDQVTAALVVDPPADTLDALGDTLRLSATVSDANGNVVADAAVTWTSLDAGVATVSANGKVESAAVGTARIVAADGALADTTTVMVRQIPAAVIVSPADSTLTAIGDTAQLAAVVQDANGNPIPGAAVTWTSLDAAIGTVDAAGRVAAVGAGTIRVVAAADEAADTAVVVVDQLYASLTLGLEADTLNAIGDTAQFAATVRDANGYVIPSPTVTWTSLAPAVATVDAAGRVIAVATGSVEIEAAADAHTDTTTVLVRQIPGSVIATLDTTTLYQDSATQATAVVADSNGVTIPGAAVTWSSADPEVAAVDGAGNVTAAREGAVAVTAASTVSGVEGSAVVAVRGRIVFVSDREGDNEIYVMNDDGSDPHRLTNDAADDTDPAWSPDGSKITFASDRDGIGSEYYDIFVMNADGSGIVNITQHDSVDADPEWSPDGSQITFTSNRDGNLEIYVMNADGSGTPQNVSSNGADDFESVWSPDGVQLVFGSDRTGGIDVYLMSADGSGALNLTPNDSLDVDPNWSPDGSQIAFASERDGAFEVYIMDADGSNVQRLTNNALLDVEPAWSADGSKVIFWRILADTSREIFVVNADGTGSPTNLTNHAAKDFAPAWRPKP